MNDEGVRKLAAALTYLVEQAPRRPGRTMLQKLIYLADVESHRERERTITGLNYIAYDHGPWLRELYDGLAAAGSIRERRYIWRLDQTAYEYEVDGNATRDYSALSEEEKGILGRVARKWGQRELSAVLEHVYSSPPYAGTGFGEQVDFGRM